jgi:hypothetical protein
MGCLCGVLDAKWGITRLSGVFLSENVAIEQGVGPPGRGAVRSELAGKPSA